MQEKTVWVGKYNRNFIVRECTCKVGYVDTDDVVHVDLDFAWEAVNHEPGCPMAEDLRVIDASFKMECAALEAGMVS